MTTTQHYDDAEAEVMQSWKVGNLTRLGVANGLRAAGFTSDYATAKAKALPADIQLPISTHALGKAIGRHFWLCDSFKDMLGTEFKAKMDVVAKAVLDELMLAPVPEQRRDRHYTRDGNGVLDAVRNLFARGTLVLGEGDALIPVQNAYLEWQKSKEQS